MIHAVDSHAHVFVRGLPLAPQRRHAPDYDAPLDDYLALLDAHGISHAVLVQPSFLGTDNRFLLEALRAAPQRLQGVAVVAPDIGEPAWQALADGGICGIRLNLVGLPLPDFTQSDWQRLLARVRELGWHVEVHRHAHDLALAAQPVLDAGCRLVVDHFGLPQAGGHGEADQTDRTAGLSGWLLRAADGGCTWVKLSAAYRSWPGASSPPARAAAQALLQAFGPGRLLWGSDWPHTQHRESIDYAATHAALADWVPDAGARQTILAETPAELFHFHSGDDQ